MALEVEIKARVSKETKARLAKIAEDRGEGVKVSVIVREAVLEYLARQDAKPHPKVTYLPRAAEGDMEG